MKRDEVWTFKLTSGEEVVAKIKDIDDDKVTLLEPHSVAPNRQGGMGLIPSMFTSESQAEIMLNTNNVSLSGPTEDNIKMKYLEVTTGITVPTKTVILG